jgi:PEP-CTERM motif
MFRNVLSAGVMAMCLSAAGAAGANTLTWAQVTNVGTANLDFVQVENQGAPGSASAFAEVGSYDYLEEFGTSSQYLRGFATVLTAREDLGPGETGLADPLYLTFDIASAGGAHAAGPFNESNLNRPYVGQVRLSYAETNLPTTFDALTPLTTFDISPDWADVGESFSFDIFSVLDSFLGFGSDVTFFLEYANRDDNDDTAWTFGNFRLTSTDQTTALPTTAVPEPGMWALMIVGFGGVGAMLRRRGVTLGVARI